MRQYLVLNGASQSSTIEFAEHDAARTTKTQLRWQQESFSSGAGLDVWAIADIELRGRPPTTPLLEFDVNVGCGAAAAASDRLDIAYSLDFGTSWLTCAPCDPLSSSSCRQWSSPCEFYPSAADSGWTKLRFSEANAARVRFRFSHVARQGLPVAIDAVRITTCPGRCSGHGTCRADGTCACDAGYAANDETGACVPLPNALPSLYRDTFDTPLGAPRQQRATGSIVASNGVCGAVGSGPKFVAAVGADDRMYKTRDIDTRNASFLEFHHRMGDGSTSCRSPTQTSEGLVVAYSSNGGLDYTYLDSVFYYESRAQVTLSLPPSARTPATHFMWWQPESSSEGYDVWTLDEIYVGPAEAEEPTAVTENFDSDRPWDDRVFVGHLGASRTGYCDYNGSAYFAPSSENSNGDQLLSTVPLDLPEGSIVQFEINFGCESVVGDFAVAVQYSDNDGVAWQDVLPSQCNPASTSSCISWTGLQGSRLEATQYQKGWHRLTMPLPGGSGHRRIRFIAVAGTTVSRRWALANLYIGNGCDGGCGGHGACRDDACVCDAGYSLADGRCVPTAPLPRDFEERFDGGLRPGNWLSTYAAGGTVTNSPCGPVASGTSFHFALDGMRALESRDLDLTNAQYLQFAIRMGAQSSSTSCRAPTQSIEGVVVAFSTDGGISYTRLTTVQYFSERTSGTLVRMLEGGGRRG